MVQREQAAESSWPFHHCSQACALHAHAPLYPTVSVNKPRVSRRASAPYNTIWEFGYTISGQPCDMAFTSVAGHLMELEFTAPFKKWRG